MTTTLLPGTVTLVGAGPGDPELVTVAGLRAVQQAEVILYDRLAPQDLLSEASDDAELVPVGKIPRGHYVPQEEINQLLVAHAREGCKVVRLKGGDSFVFGRGGEEWQACAEAGIPVRVIPGVSSATAGPALAGIPLTHRHLVQGFTVVSGHVSPSDERSEVPWRQLAKDRLTLVILMGVAHMRDIAPELMAGGLPADTPVRVVSNASLASQESWRTTLGDAVADMDAHHVRPPALVVVGTLAGVDLSHPDHRAPSDH
ncbi:CobA Uroporphyrinogen III methyltransferase [Propionibacterium freudenreichii]|uniref:uroporphyrinogen-III C-methyltransferase n=1 Tax=Propionibacterium freudenreichii TaxID=1744 RepID=UPI0005A5C549|nr:uroporphyrinogen-III C-methyltransferase [Propionibacterium freudenreichii]CEI25542.1 CobA Uroporphyrinogen III methyltransferase [Propionibacterium freudenreichii]SBN96218.1 Putative uroporphyrinogen III methyltransferase [Propionibacterium freudenreichii]SCC97803.1 Putative uroporphyrinogen III methyltransferase [Propionibacterium freudenreichii]